MRKVKQRAISAALLTAALILTGGCSVFGSFPDRVVLARESVTKDQVSAVLAAADQTFRQDAVDEHAAIDAKSRCFVAFAGRDRNQGGDALWCGPTRVYGSVADQVWIKLPVHPDGHGSVERDSPDFTPVVRPANLVLARPDDASPADGAGLKVSRPPAEQAGVVKVISAEDLGPVQLKPPQDNGLLLGPKTAVKVAAVGRSDVYGSGSAARSAASGEQFLFLQWGPTPSFGTVVSTDAEPGQLSDAYISAPIGAVVVGSTRHPLDQLTVPANTNNDILLVSAPRGVPVYYEVSDQGRALRYDMGVAARTAMPEFAPLYRTKNYLDLNKRLTATLTPAAAGEALHFHMTFKRAALTPFDPDKGYAPAGKVWMAITVPDYKTDDGTFDIPKFSADAFVVTPAGGAPINATQITTTSFPDRLLAAVSPQTTSATLTCRWNAVLTFISTRAARPSAAQTMQITIPSS